MKNSLHRSIPFVSLGIALTLILRFTVFGLKEAVMAFSDALFVSGMVLVLISIFLYVSASGFFDRAIYGFFSLRRIFKREVTKSVTFDEFMVERKKPARNRVPALCGIFFLAISVLLATAC